jgi:outer membrane protein assembly factor BamA
MFLNKIFFKTLIFIAFFLSIQVIYSSENEIDNVEWISSLPINDFKNLIKIKEGGKYSLKNVRRTVKLLYSTKLFEQVIIIKSQNESRKLNITIKAIPQLFISDVSISGNRALSDNRIKLAADMRLNRPYYTHEIEKIRDEILFLYRDNGFFNSQVSVGTTIETDNTVSININISEGSQEKIQRIKLSGNLSVSERKTLSFELNRQFLNKPLIENNVSNIDIYISDKYKDAGFLDVKTNTSSLPDGTVTCSINKGPLFKLKISGVKSFSAQTVEQIITSVTNYHFNSDGVVKKLSVFYQVFGFPDVEVNVETINTGSVFNEYSDRIISVSIKENDRRFVDDFVFTGVSDRNRKILMSRIKDYLEKKIDEENFPLITINRSSTGGGYSDTDGTRIRALHRSRKNKVMLPKPPLAIPEEYLEDIKKVVLNVFRHEGYRDVEVLNVALKKGNDSYYLEIGVNENTLYLLTSVKITTGNNELDEEIKGEIFLPKEIPYSDKIASIYNERITRFLQNKGFIFSRLTMDEIIKGNKVQLDFAADFLFNVKASEVVISGNHLTYSGIIKRIVRINKGDTLKGDTLVSSRRNLLQTGIFQSATISFIDPEFPSDEKDVVVTVSEIERFKVTPGIGISTDEGFRLTGAAEWRNVLKTAFSTRLNFRISRKLELFMTDSFKKYFKNDFSLWEQIERKVNLAFMFPDIYLRTFPLSAQLEAFHIHDIRSNGGLPYMIDKNGLHLSFFRRFNENYFLSTGLEIAYQSERDHKKDDDGNVTYSNFDRLIITPEIRGYIDHRSNIFFPVTGYKTSHKIFNKTTLYGRSGHYTQIENNFSFFIPLFYRQSLTGDLEPLDTFIFHTFLETAVIIKHSGDLSSDDVLKLGGSTSIRGFAGDSIAPADKTDDNHQGRYYLFMRNELRVKLIDKLYMVSFLDLGNLWEELSNMGNNELFRYAGGGGLTFVSPIGALSAQIGFNLNPLENEQKWALHIFISTF